jgi:16S rRNA processing protein RimM
LTVTNLQGQTLGTVADLIDTGAHSVLRITADGAEHLVPFVAAYIGDVNLAERRITVDWQADWSA